MFLTYIPRENFLQYTKQNHKFDKLNFFSYSREAIFAIAQEINLNKDDEVLLPDYICNTVIDALYPFTKNIKFYKINIKMSFDENEVLSCLNRKTKLVVFVDYFGVETDISQELINTIKNKDIKILKDSAHSFLTLINNQFNSAYKYDYLVSSIYKNLSLHIGAIAIGKFKKNHAYVNATLLQKRKFIFIIKKILCFLGVSNFINRGIENIIITSDTKNSFYEGKNGVTDYRNKLNSIDFDSILRKRKKIINEFYEFFQKKSLFNQEQVQKNILQAFPVKFESKKERDAMLNILRTKCIDVYTWPSFHPLSVQEELWSSILLLPLDIRVLKTIRNEFKNV